MNSFLGCLFFANVIQCSVLYFFRTMARRKKKPDDVEHNSVKCALATIINEDCRQPFITIISEMSIQATYITVLGSLLFLHKVKTGCDVCCLLSQHCDLFFLILSSRQMMPLTIKTRLFSMETVKALSSIVSTQCSFKITTTII